MPPKKKSQGKVPATTTEVVGAVSADAVSMIRSSVADTGLEFEEEAIAAVAQSVDDYIKVCTGLQGAVRGKHFSPFLTCSQ